MWEPSPHASGAFATDALGFRGGARPARHPGMLRVAVVGDAVTMGLGVRCGASFCGQLGATLRRELAAIDVDIVCAGCPAYTTVQNRLDLLERVLPLSPDVVVIALTGWNDAAPAAVFDDSTWQRRRARLRSFDASPLGALRVFSLAAEALLLPSRERIAAARDANETGSAAAERVGAADSTANVASMIADCEAAGARPLVLLLPPPRAGSASESRQARGARERLALAHQVAERAGSRVVEVDLEDARFFDEIHPDEQGHRAIAHALAARLLEDEILALRARNRDRAATVAKPPSVRSVEPAVAFAFGGGTFAITGEFAKEDVRFFLGGEPLRLRGLRPDGVALADVPPLPPGRLDLEVIDASGSSTLAAAVAARGPELAASEEGGVVRIVLQAPRGLLARVLVGRAPGAERKTYGRSLWIAKKSLLQGNIEDRIGGDGALRVEVPVPSEFASGSVLLQAIVDAPPGPQGGIALFSERIELRLGAF